MCGTRGGGRFTGLGLADEDSDVDRRGVFVLPFPWTSGLVEPPRDLVSADGSSSYWELEKTMRQGIRPTPTPSRRCSWPRSRPGDEIGEWLLESRDAFVSAEIYRSFGRYALSQLKKLNPDPSPGGRTASWSCVGSRTTPSCRSTR